MIWYFGVQPHSEKFAGKKFRGKIFRLQKPCQNISAPIGMSFATT